MAAMLFNPTNERMTISTNTMVNPGVKRYLILFGSISRAIEFYVEVGPQINAIYAEVDSTYALKLTLAGKRIIDFYHN